MGTVSQSNIPLIAEGIVPDGCVYISTSAHYALYNPGSSFPEPKVGDTFKTPEYIYTLFSNTKFQYVGKYLPWGIGWAVRTMKRQKSYGAIQKQINGIKVRITNDLFANCSKMEMSPEIPESVTHADRMYINCTELRQAPKLPNELLSMKEMFASCTKMPDAPDIPELVLNMDASFFKCHSLTQMPKIPKTVQNIDGYFFKCKSLELTTALPLCKKYIDTFCGCESLKMAPAIPDGTESIEGMFRQCKSLRRIPILTSSLKNISHAFKDCVNLRMSARILSHL